MKNQLNTFSPHPFIKNAHVQTLLSYVLGRGKKLPSKTHFIELDDGDQISLEVSTPKDWQENHQTVLMMPGTAGSHLSPYLVRIGWKLLLKGYQVIRLNYRGMATAHGRAKRISHAGSSNDIYEAITYIKNVWPDSPLAAVGFSLSGNTLLKLGGEKPLDELEKLIAVCPPLNLATSSKRLEKRENRLYQRSIVKTIFEVVSSPTSAFEFDDLQSLKNCKTLREVDNVFTAPFSGFRDAQDYYAKSSCMQYVPHIKAKAKLLFAKDDPLIDCSPINNLSIPPNLDVLTTKYGGHMGYYELGKKDPYWMDRKLLEWI